MNCPAWGRGRVQTRSELSEAELSSRPGVVPVASWAYSAVNAVTPLQGG